MKLEIEISKITVIRRAGDTDLIRIYTTIPSKIWGGAHLTSLETQTGEGMGVQWVRESFGIEPEVLP